MTNAQARDDARRAFAQSFCHQIGCVRHELIPLASDASARTYWRLVAPDSCYIVMDSPLDKQPVQPFLEKARWLHEHHVPVPLIFKQDLEQGFLVLEDFGDVSLKTLLNQKPVIQQLEPAVDVLVTLANLAHEPMLESYTQERWIRDTQIFNEWCVDQLHLSLCKQKLNSLYELLANCACDQPQGVVHRDYHSMNIHVLGDSRIGIIDFQDAFWGPQGYDLISLLEDRYIAWSDEILFNQIELFRQKLGKIQAVAAPDVFRQQVLWVGLMRNIRILGVFHRLLHRDQKPGYMDYMPRFAYYCRRVLALYPELQSTGSELLQCLQEPYWQPARIALVDGSKHAAS